MSNEGYIDFNGYKTAAKATLHCLTGCAIGEVLGMIVSTAFAWSAAPSIAISIGLAFFFGYLLSIRPLLQHGLGLKKSLKIAFAADTASITVMEITDNGFILIVPGAIHAGLSTFLVWASLIISLCRGLSGICLAEKQKRRPRQGI